MSILRMISAICLMVTLCGCAHSHQHAIDDNWGGVTQVSNSFRTT
ncbi:hypothetical protein LCGC14_0788880 [marine sediment metagenome]|uniref:Uncharacterized protein n=1 Tax=marine sediment metagenome TaxID=412755 RepID=A0A0F9QD43_9ZZZZ